MGDPRPGRAGQVKPTDRSTDHRLSGTTWNRDDSWRSTPIDTGPHASPQGGNHATPICIYRDGSVKLPGPFEGAKQTHRPS